MAAEVTQSSDAVVVDSYSVGSWLRTRADDPGLSIGWTRRSYVYSRVAVPNAAPGWHYFAIPLADLPAVVVDARTTGIELRPANREVRLALGYAATTILAQIPNDESVVLAASYQPAHPELTHIYTKREDR